MECTQPQLTHDNEESAGAAIELLASLLALQPSVPTVPRRGLSPEMSANIRYVPQEFTSIERKLTARFSPKMLLATNCFEAVSTGETQLITGLRTPDAPVILLYESAAAAPFAIAAEGRPGTSPPMFSSMVRDHETRSRIEHWGGVLVGAASLAETIAWIQWGLPAAPLFAVGREKIELFWGLLSQLQRVDCDEVFNIRRKLKDNPGRHILRRKLFLRFVLVTAAWDPESCHQVEAAREQKSAAVLRRLLIPTSPQLAGGIWRPTEKLLKGLEQVVFTGPPQSVTERISFSLREHLKLLTGPGVDSEKKQPDDLIKVRRRLISPSSAPYDMQVEAKRDYLAKLESEQIAPLLRSGVGESDAEQQLLLETEAMLFRRMADVDIDVATQANGVAGRAKSTVELCNLTKTFLAVLEARHRSLRGGRHARR